MSDEAFLLHAHMVERVNTVFSCDKGNEKAKRPYDISL